jgi:hypothetical protein
MNVKMAGWKVLVLTNFLFSLFCFLWAEKQPDTLNVLSILLPYSTAGSANVNFTIWASDGCYKWFVLLHVFYSRLHAFLGFA